MLAFAHIDKTAGTTIFHILRQSFGAGHCDVRLPSRRNAPGRSPVYTVQDLRRIQRWHWNLRSIAGHAIAPYSDLALVPQLFLFTFLRDPVERCISDYLYSITHWGRTWSWNEWLDQSPRARNWQTYCLSQGQDAQRAIEIVENRVKFVGLVERFDESLLLLRQAHPCAEWDLFYRPQNIGRSNPLRDQLRADRRVWAELEEANQADRQLYRHACEILFPKQVAQYRGTLADDARALGRSRDGMRANCRRQLRRVANRLMRNVYDPAIFRRSIPRLFSLRFLDKWPRPRVQ